MITDVESAMGLVSRAKKFLNADNMYTEGMSFVDAMLVIIETAERRQILIEAYEGNEEAKAKMEQGTSDSITLDQAKELVYTYLENQGTNKPRELTFPEAIFVMGVAAEDWERVAIEKVDSMMAHLSRPLPTFETLLNEEDTSEEGNGS